MGANNETGFAKTIAILAGIATIVGVVIAILNWLMPFSPVGSSPLAPSPIASITTYLNSPDVNATISGFVIAFFAEPVKIYFQNRAKLNDLRVALYKKLLANYVSLYFLIQDKSPLSGSKKANYYRMPLRRECYEHALENEISLFYRLNESSHINVLQGSTLYRLVEIS